MRHHPTIAAVLALALLLTTAATQAQDTGSADFTRYVALGDSLTAGYSNNSLLFTHQVTSLGALLHDQTGAGGSFEQPWVLEPGLRNELFLLSLDPGPIITAQPGSIDWPSWVLDPQDPNTGSFPNFYLGQPLGYQPYDNLGIPGMSVVDADSTVCDGPLEDVFQNPYYCSILRNPECEPVFDDPSGGTCSGPAGGMTALEQALFSDENLGISPATFMTVWLGSNDALGAATSGVVIDGETLTPLPEFTAAYQDIIQQISDAGVQMAIANVPDVTSIPWVTTIPPFLVDPITGDPVIDPGTGQLVFLLGTTGTGAQRTLTMDDRVLLSASVLLAAGAGIPPQYGGTGEYLPDDVILDETELATIDARIAAYNDVIATAAQNAGAAFVDIHTRMNDIRANGVVLGGLIFTTDFLTGGLFGYDGVHPTNLGYGVIAQWFVDAINETYGASIPPVDLGPLVVGNGQFPVADAGGAVFTLEARDAMLGAMGVPSIEELEEIQRRILDERMSPHRRPAGGRRDALERRARQR